MTTDDQHPDTLTLTYTARLSLMTDDELAADAARATRRVANACWGLADAQRQDPAAARRGDEGAVTAATAECDEAEAYLNLVTAEVGLRRDTPRRPGRFVDDPARYDEALRQEIASMLDTPPTVPYPGHDFDPPPPARRPAFLPDGSPNPSAG